MRGTKAKPARRILGPGVVSLENSRFVEPGRQQLVELRALLAGEPAQRRSDISGDRHAPRLQNVLERRVAREATRVYDGYLEPTGLGANPYGIAVDPSDWTIYVGSAQCCGVQVWTTSDHVAYTLKGVIDPTGGPRSTTSQYPARIAVGNDGTVYIADMTLNTIQAFTSQATGMPARA